MKEPSRMISCMFPAPSRNTTTLQVFMPAFHQRGTALADPSGLVLEKNADCQYYFYIK